jgi:hypothetical protein
MNAVVFEHVPVAELPEKWRADLDPASGRLVTVRIEEEAMAPAAQTSDSKTSDSKLATDGTLFGMWRDREDMADVAAYVRKLRASRFNEDGTRREV